MIFRSNSDDLDKNNPTLSLALKQKRIHSRLLVCRPIVFHWLLWRGHGSPRQILQETLPQHPHSVIRWCVQKDSQFRIRLWIVFIHYNEISMIWTSFVFSTISCSPLFFCFATLKYIYIYIISLSKDEDWRLQRTSSLCCLGCLVHSCSFAEASAAGIQTGHPTLLLCLKLTCSKQALVSLQRTSCWEFFQQQK